MFLAENLSVEDRAVKFAASALFATSLEGALYHDWAEAQNIWQMVDATFAYAVQLFSIRQHDYSGLVLLLVLHNVRYFTSVAMSLKEQKKLLSETVNSIFRLVHNSFEQNYELHILSGKMQ